jgi:hypothetical protein
MSEQREREVERQLAETRRAAARVEVEANRFRNEAVERQAACFVMEGRASALRTELELTQERLRARQDELQGARNQNAALRAELASAKATDEPQESEKVEDATVQRFRMLELD